jgi:hypothetical protein
MSIDYYVSDEDSCAALVDISNKLVVGNFDKKEQLNSEECEHQPSADAFYTSMNVVFCEKCQRRIKKPGSWVLY